LNGIAFSPEPTATVDSLANLNAVAVGSGLNDLGCGYAALG
jgi:hypothetical protein